MVSFSSTIVHPEVRASFSPFALLLLLLLCLGLASLVDQRLARPLRIPTRGLPRSRTPGLALLPDHPASLLLTSYLLSHSFRWCRGEPPVDVETNPIRWAFGNFPSL